MLPIVRSAGHSAYTSTRKAGEFYEYTHTHNVIGLHLKTAGAYITGKERHQLSGPVMGVLPQGELDSNGLMGELEFYYVKFDWDGVRSDRGEHVTLESHGSRLHRSHIRRLAPAELRRGVELFRDLLELSRQPGLAAQLRAGARVLDLLALWSELPAQSGRERSVRIYRNLIEQYADAPDVSLSEIAARVGLSADHLGVLFQKEMGMSPVEYRTRLRLLRARELLVTTARSVGEIAEAVGFPNASYFTRLFRKTFGMAPLEFARAQVYAGPEQHQGG